MEQQSYDNKLKMDLNLLKEIMVQIIFFWWSLCIIQHVVFNKLIRDSNVTIHIEIVL